MEFLRKYKAIIVYAATIVFSLLFIILGYFVCSPQKAQNPADADVYTAKVTAINEVRDQSYSLSGGNSIAAFQIYFNAVITSGGLLNDIEISAVQTIDEMMPINPKQVEIGDSVILNHLDLNDGNGLSWVFNEYQRSNALIILCVAFLIMLIVFGRKKGINTIISLVFTVLAVFAVFVPSILNGFNIYFMATITAVFVIFMTLLLINGASKKTLCAIAGNIGGLAVAGILTAVLGKVLHLTGAVDEQAIYLLYLNQEHPIDLNAVIFGGIVIGALGATMDVAMTIASALHELAENMDNKSFYVMLKSGFNIGRDAMSTMTNTLVLAYIGSSLSVVLLLAGSDSSLLSLFNREMIVVEVIRAIVGSIGILCAIPITSVLAAYIYNRPVKVK